MPWKWRPESRFAWARWRLRGLSLRQRLLLCLLPLTVVITSVELWSTQRDALAAANSAYDRSIRGALKAIEANISTASGGLAVELPYRLFELLELTATGHVYFRVASQDGLVEVGNLDLPAPKGQRLQVHEPVFNDALYLGERVRMGSLLTHVKLQGETGPVTPVVIQVAEQAWSREQFAAQFVRNSLLRAGVVLVALAAVVVVVVWWLLRPLGRLEAQVRGRQPSDVSPLSTQDLPRDVRPLVQAVNTQMARRQALADQQRQFLDDASHQLRTPLTTLRTQADFALRALNVASPPEPAASEVQDVLRESLQAMVEQVDAATRSANQLLSMARSDAAEPQWERFDLSQLVRDAVKPLLPRARQRQLDLGVDVPDALWVHGDPTLWREALVNLLDNALRYALPNTAVTASAESVPSLSPVWRVVVCNVAAPMPHALHQLLSQPETAPGPEVQRFVRGEGARLGGAGLGLAIARRLAERHGGQLAFAQDGEGWVRVSVQWATPQGLSPSELKAN